jgi:hypothetical protein
VLPKIIEEVEGDLSQVATSTVDYLIDGLDQVPTGSATESLSSISSDLSVEEENPYTPQDALRSAPAATSSSGSSSSSHHLHHHRLHLWQQPGINRSSSCSSSWYT